MSGFSTSWVEEVPHVLWDHRTMPKSSNGDTPYSLVYGSEAAIPAEIGVSTRRIFELQNNDKKLLENLDLVEERREIAAIHEARYKSRVRKYYNK